MNEAQTQLTKNEKLPSVKELQKQIDSIVQKDAAKFSMPTVGELHKDHVEISARMEALNAILSTDPPKEWVKEHPYVNGWKYVPIGIVEELLRRIFKKSKTEIMREGTAFNGVYVVVRVHYFNPATGEMDFQDGIGAMDLQTKKGASPADLANINKGAITMAFPIAKSLAVKDACELIGNVFGGNLNRKDLIPFKIDGKLMEDYHTNRFEKALDNE